MMYSNSNRSIYKIAALIISSVVTLSSCAAVPNQSGETKSNKSASKSFVEMVGDQKCLPEDKRIPMSRELIGPYTAYYPNKLIRRMLSVGQITCDLGRPHEVKTTTVKLKMHQMPMQAGDRFLRWGENHTNNPTDEISVMVVASSSGEVSSIITYDTKAKKLSRVSVTEDGTNVSTGTYTSTRTVTKR